MKTAALVAALSVSLLLNAALLLRRPEERPAPTPSVRPPAPVPTIPPKDVDIPYVPPPAAAVVPFPAAVTAPAPVVAAAIPEDVERVIRAREDVDAFWKELDRVFKARPRLEEERYVATLLGALHGFLKLPEASRPGFEAALKSGAMRLAEIRKEHEIAKQALPPKDKSNPAALAVYEREKDALDLSVARKKEAVVENVRLHLDPADPRHAELSGRLERLMRNLGPR